MGDDAATAGTTTEGVGFDPFEPGFHQNPYDQYRRIREASPVLSTDLGPTLITRWADVHQLLRDPSTSVEDRNATMGGRAQRLADLAPSGTRWAPRRS